MRGMNVNTGATIEGVEHLKQSIQDILTTPIGSRLMRRNYGSGLFRLIDRPLNGPLIAEIQTAVISALAAYEPRIKIHQVEVSANNNGDMTTSGKVELTITGVYIPENKTITLKNITL